MKHENIKVILVREQVEDSFKKVESFLVSNDYEIKEASKQTNNEYYVEGHNKENRFWKLFKSNRPQILKLTFKTSPEKKDYTEIQTVYGYFRNYISKTYFWMVFAFVAFAYLFATLINIPESFTLSRDPGIILVATLVAIPVMIFLGHLFISLLLSFHNYHEFFSSIFRSANNNYIEKYNSENPRQKMVFFIIVILITLLVFPYFAELLTAPALSGIIVFILALCSLLFFTAYKLANSNSGVFKKTTFMLHIFYGTSSFMIYLNMFSLTGLVYKNFQLEGFGLRESIEGILARGIAISNIEYVIYSLYMAFPFLMIMVYIIVSSIVHKGDLRRMPVEFENFKRNQIIWDTADALAYRNLSKDNFIFAVIVFLFWLLFTIGIVIGMVFCFGILEYVLLGNNRLFHFGLISFTLKELKVLFDFIALRFSFFSSDLFFKLIFFIYLLPVLFVIVMQISINLRRFAVTRSILRDCGSYSKIDNILKKIAMRSNIEVPGHCITEEPGISVKSLYVGIPYKKNFILINKGALDKLNEEELTGILAHEIYHVKKHTFIFRGLNLLSDWTLMGKGFLVNVLNPIKMEFEADDFAVCWLKEQGIERGNYIRALKKTEIFKARTMSPWNVQSMGIIGNHKNTEEFCKKMRVYANTQKEILMKIYFSDEILSYVYPTTEERIERLKNRRAGI